MGVVVSIARRYEPGIMEIELGGNGNGGPWEKRTGCQLIRLDSGSWRRTQSAAGMEYRSSQYTKLTEEIFICKDKSWWLDNPDPVLVLHHPTDTVNYFRPGWPPVYDGDWGWATLGKSGLYPDCAWWATSVPPHGVWIGVGGKVGAMTTIVGAEASLVVLYRADAYAPPVYLRVTGVRRGLGLGGGANVCAVLATGVNSPSDFDGMEAGGFDFNISLGGKWGPLLKFLDETGKLAEMGNALAKMWECAKAGTVISKLEWENAVGWAKFAVQSDSTLSSQKNLNCIDMPVGVGLELSAYVLEGKAKLLNSARELFQK